MISAKKLQEIIEELINKQMEPYNLTYKRLHKKQHSFIVFLEEWIRRKFFLKPKKKFFEKYTMTSLEEEKFKEWGVNLLRKRLRCSKKKAEEEMSWILLNYGLRIKDAL